MNSFTYVTDCNQMDAIWQDVPIDSYCCFSYIQTDTVNKQKTHQNCHSRSRWLLCFQQILYICDDAPTSVKQRARCHDSSTMWLSLCVDLALTPQFLLSRLKHTVQHYRALFLKQNRSLSILTPVKFTAAYPESVQWRSCEYGGFNTHHASTAFSHTLKTPFHVSTAGNVIWCMIMSDLK